MIQPQRPGKVSRERAIPAPWRRTGSVMGLTICVAIVSLLMRGCAGSTPDAVLYGVWAPMAILIGMGGFVMVRGFLAILNEPNPRRATGICGSCHAGSLQMLTRVRPGRAPAWVGSRCRHCGTIFRRVDGQIVGFPAATASGPPDEAGITFEDEAAPQEIVFVDEPKA
jgi:hypothetical protein